MTNKPEIAQEPNFLPGLAAVALFLVMAAVFLTANFPNPAGFGENAEITASIGYAMFNIPGGDVGSEGFLVVFEIIDIVLVAALVGAVMLARREQGMIITAVSDTTRDVSNRLRGGEE